MDEFWDWWQHLPQHISPVIFQIGAFKLQYYGLMYIVAFAITYALVRYRVRHEDRFEMSVDQIKDAITYLIIGLIIGARLGYVLFYNLSYYLKHPLEIILPFSFSMTAISFNAAVFSLLDFILFNFSWLFAALLSISCTSFSRDRLSFSRD